MFWVSLTLFITTLTLIVISVKLRKNKRIADSATKAMIASEQKFKILFDNSSDEIYVADLNGNLVEVNSVACQTLGYSKDELLRMNFEQLKTPKYRHEVRENIRIIRQRHFHTYETEQVTKQGKILTVEMKSRLIEFNGRQLIMSIARNIEQRKEMEKQIISTIIKTEQKERKRFAADLHDDLAPILSTIKLYSDLLKSKKINDPKASALINDIDELVDMAITTTKDLQNRITPTVLQDFGLAAAINEFCKYINRTKSINIELDTQMYQKVNDNLIETIIFQVTKELINNTLKHSQATQVKIQLKVLNNQLILYYRDNGIGFNIEEMLKNSQGLGLNNIINKIKTIKGQCDFNSRQGKGMFVLISIKLKS